MKISCAKFHHPFCWKKHWLNSPISAKKFFKFHFKFNKKNPRIHEHFLHIFFSFWNMQNGIWKKIWLMRDTKHILNKRHTTYSFPVLPAPLVGTVWQYHYLHKQPQMSRSKHNKYEKLHQQLQTRATQANARKKNQELRKKWMCNLSANAGSFEIVSNFFAWTSMQIVRARYISNTSKTALCGTNNDKNVYCSLGSLAIWFCQFWSHFEFWQFFLTN